jgi:hypothetical protein
VSRIPELQREQTKKQERGEGEEDDALIKQLGISISFVIILIISPFTIEGIFADMGE